MPDIFHYRPAIESSIQIFGSRHLNICFFIKRRWVTIEFDSSKDKKRPTTKEIGYFFFVNVSTVGDATAACAMSAVCITQPYTQAVIYNSTPSSFTPSFFLLLSREFPTLFVYKYILGLPLSCCTNVARLVVCQPIGHYSCVWW